MSEHDWIMTGVIWSPWIFLLLLALAGIGPDDDGPGGLP